MDPSLESSLKILIEALACIAGDINYTRHCANILFNAKAGELSVTYSSCICERPAPIGCCHWFNKEGKETEQFIIDHRLHM